MSEKTTIQQALADARAELARLQALKVEWEEKRQAAQEQAAQLEQDAGNAVLDGADAAQVSSDIAAARAAADVAVRTISAVESKIKAARKSEMLAQVADLRQQHSERINEYRTHMKKVDQLKRQLRDLDHAEYGVIRPFVPHVGGVVADAPHVVAMPISEGLALDVQNLKTRADALEAQALRN